MIRIIDRYLLKGFLFSFAVVFIAMVGLTIMIDMVLNLDEFLKVGEEQAAGGAGTILGHIAEYYFYRLFEYFQLLCGAAMLVGAAFSIARLNKNNELIALKASGVSVYRLLWPIFVAGLAISLVYVVNQEVIIPTFAEKLSAERRMAPRTKEFVVSWVRDQNNSVVFAPLYSPRDEVMRGEMRQIVKDGPFVCVDPVQIVERRPDTGENIAVINADEARYNALKGGWELTNATRWRIPRAGEEVNVQFVGEPIAFFKTDITPVTLLRQKDADFYQYFSYHGMRQLLRQSIHGNPRMIEVAMHKHFSKPILNLVLLMLGLPFVVGQEGKSYLISVMSCIGLFVLVLATDYITTEFGHSGDISPVLAAYIPVLVFTPVAIWSLERIRT